MCIVTFDWEENDAYKKVNEFEKKKSLVFAVVELTRMCNFNCVWCYAAGGKNSFHMPKERALLLAKILGESGLKQVTCSGGEPLMYPYLKEFIKECKEYGLIVHINTNGYFLTKKLAKELESLGLSQVQTNIDSLDPEKHNQVRGNEKSFEKAIKALKNSIEAGMTAVSQTVLTKDNENEIVDIFKFARSFGVQRCRVWDMIPCGTALENTEKLPTDFVGTMEKLCEYAEETGVKSIESADPLFPYNLNTKIKFYGGVCASSKGGFTTITPEGDILFCATFRKRLYNVFDVFSEGNGLQKTHKEKINEFVKNLPISEKCKNCEYFNLCGGGCPTRRMFNPEKTDYWCKIINSN